MDDFSLFQEMIARLKAVEGRLGRHEAELASLRNSPLLQHGGPEYLEGVALALQNKYDAFQKHSDEKIDRLERAAGDLSKSADRILALERQAGRFEEISGKVLKLERARDAAEKDAARDDRPAEPMDFEMERVKRLLPGLPKRVDELEEALAQVRRGEANIETALEKIDVELSGARGLLEKATQENSGALESVHKQKDQETQAHLETMRKQIGRVLFIQKRVEEIEDVFLRLFGVGGEVRENNVRRFESLLNEKARENTLSHEMNRRLVNLEAAINQGPRDGVDKQQIEFLIDGILKREAHAQNSRMDALFGAVDALETSVKASLDSLKSQNSEKSEKTEQNEGVFKEFESVREEISGLTEQNRNELSAIRQELNGRIQKELEDAESRIEGEREQMRENMARLEVALGALEELQGAFETEIDIQNKKINEIVEWINDKTPSSADWEESAGIQSIIMIKEKLAALAENSKKSFLQRKSRLSGVFTLLDDMLDAILEQAERQENAGQRIQTFEIRANETRRLEEGLKKLEDVLKQITARIGDLESDQSSRKEEFIDKKEAQDLRKSLETLENGILMRIDQLKIELVASSEADSNFSFQQIEKSMKDLKNDLEELKSETEKGIQAEKDSVKQITQTVLRLLGGQK